MNITEYLEALTMFTAMVEKGRPAAAHQFFFRALLPPQKLEFYEEQVEKKVENGTLDRRRGKYHRVTINDEQILGELATKYHSTLVALFHECVTQTPEHHVNGLVYARLTELYPFDISLFNVLLTSQQDNVNFTNLKPIFDILKAQRRRHDIFLLLQAMQDKNIDHAQLVTQFYPYVAARPANALPSVERKLEKYTLAETVEQTLVELQRYTIHPGKRKCICDYVCKLLLWQWIFVCRLEMICMWIHNMHLYDAMY